MMTLIWKPLAIGALAFALIAIPSAYIKGRSDGASLERTKAMTALKNQLDERNATNEQIRSLDDAGLCAALGGVFTGGICQ